MTAAHSGFRSTYGMGLVELLIAMTILVIVLAVSAEFLAQQSRASALSQATNDAEVTARTIAEAVVQDFQLAGSRATFVGGTVTYEPLNATCTETDRTGCIAAQSVLNDGTIQAVPSGASPNGYTIWYRTSLTPAPSECRRIDYAYFDTSVYRSDVACTSTLASIDLDTSLFATGVQELDVAFTCSDGTTPSIPSDCYDGVPEHYVQQADVTVGVTVGGRVQVNSEMQMRAYTPNMRPSVNYGSTEE